jgi:hypothetical protein
VVNRGSLVTEEPGIVFSVKELISRLDGKLDMMMNVLTNKADRSDLAAIDHRVGRVEDDVAALNTAAKAKNEAHQEHVNTHRWRLTAVISAIATVLMLAGLVITLVVK